MMKRTIAMLLAALPLLAADVALIEKGRQEERKACTPCHGLRIIHVQRISRGAWERELDKMGRWGWPGKEREALLEYLVAGYGDDKPPAKLPLSTDGTAK